MTATATTTPSVCEVLDEAARLIREVGWCQQTYSKWDRGEPIGFCAIGALTSAAHRLLKEDFTNSAVPTAAEHKLAGAIGGSTSITRFNDAPGRTKEEVLAKFAEAKKLAGCPD